MAPRVQKLIRFPVSAKYQKAGQSTAQDLSLPKPSHESYQRSLYIPYLRVAQFTLPEKLSFTHHHMKE
jgi:hypothetical protein